MTRASFRLQERCPTFVNVWRRCGFFSCCLLSLLNVYYFFLFDFGCYHHCPLINNVR